MSRPYTENRDILVFNDAALAQADERALRIVTSEHRGRINDITRIAADTEGAYARQVVMLMKETRRELDDHRVVGWQLNAVTTLENAAKTLPYLQAGIAELLEVTKKNSVPHPLLNGKPSLNGHANGEGHPQKGRPALF